jgi:hypothetical protein
MGTLLAASQSAHFVFAAYIRAAFVDRAQQRVAVERHAPAILQPAHHFAPPFVFMGQVARHVVIAHQDDFELATAGPAGGASDFRRGIHGRHCPTQGESPPRCGG